MRTRSCKKKRLVFFYCSYFTPCSLFNYSVGRYSADVGCLQWAPAGYSIPNRITEDKPFLRGGTCCLVACVFIVSLVYCRRAGLRERGPRKGTTLRSRVSWKPMSVSDADLYCYFDLFRLQVSLTFVTGGKQASD